MMDEATDIVRGSILVIIGILILISLANALPPELLREITIISVVLIVIGILSALFGFVKNIFKD